MTHVFIFNLPESLGDRPDLIQSLVSHLENVFSFNEVGLEMMCNAKELDGISRRFLNQLKETFMSQIPAFDDVFHCGNVTVKDQQLIVLSRYW